MIKTFLKYKIVESAIVNLFDQITKTFNPNVREPKTVTGEYIFNNPHEFPSGETIELKQFVKKWHNGDRNDIITVGRKLNVSPNYVGETVTRITLTLYPRHRILINGIRDGANVNIGTVTFHPPIHFSGYGCHANDIYEVM